MPSLLFFHWGGELRGLLAYHLLHVSTDWAPTYSVCGLGCVHALEVYGASQTVIVGFSSVGACLHTACCTSAPTEVVSRDTHVMEHRS